MSLGSRSIWIAACLLVGSGAAVSSRVPQPEKCAAAKTKASALAVSAQMQCQAKAASKGAAVDAQCLEKAESRLRARFGKADAKEECLGDADSALAAAGACTTAFADAVSGDASCVAKKLKAAGTSARAEAACARKADEGDAIVCLAKAEKKLRDAIDKADQHGTCTGTADELAALIDECVITLGQPKSAH